MDGNDDFDAFDAQKKAHLKSAGLLKMKVRKITRQ